MFAQPRTFLILVFALFGILAFSSAATRAPWCDEAYFAEPAYQLLHIGKMASVVVPPSPIDDPKTVGTDRYTFYTLPLDLVVQAAWYRVVGFGLLQLRTLSLLWGMVALFAWNLILKSLGANPRLRLLCLLMIGLDYTFVRVGSDGRMDMMSAALGFLGIGLFLNFQPISYTRAVLYGSCCAAASFFTHPIGGLMATVGLAIAILLKSRGRLRWYHIPLAAVPYLLFAAAWGVYIAQAPDIFVAQFSSVSNGRLSAWKTPLSTITREFTKRWAEPFGMVAGSGIKATKALVLLLYAAGLIWATASLGQLRQQGFAFLVAAAWANLLLLCFVEATKSAAYLIHAIPWIAVLSAILLYRYFRPIGAIVLCAILAIQVGGTAYIISKLQYQRQYLPAIAFLKQRTQPITGVAELGFGLGFQPTLTDDRRLGFYTGNHPNLYVIDATYQGAAEEFQTTHPEIYQYLQNKRENSHLLFENPLYKIYSDENSRKGF